MTLGFKFQLQPITEVFQVYITLKCIHDSIVHQDLQYMNN
jgi:hypothetical protein